MLVLNSKSCNSMYHYHSQPKLILKTYKRSQRRIASQHNTPLYFRTNVLADFIDKYTNDINMITLTEDSADYDSDYQCKYIAMFNCILILVILLIMFIDSNSKKD